MSVGRSNTLQVLELRDLIDCSAREALPLEVAGLSDPAQATSTVTPITLAITLHTPLALVSHCTGT